MMHTKYPLALLLSFLFAACAGSNSHEPTRGETRAAQNSKADTGDLCEGLFYGDGEFCDCWCPNPDPDCDEGLPLWEDCGEPQVLCNEETPCATCTGPDCPELECLDGVCVEVTPVECDDEKSCATCTGLDCPELECVNGTCVVSEATDCDAGTPCATCTGLECPNIECIQGTCVEVQPAECDETLSCASCTGLECPVLECLEGQCIEVTSAVCPDPADADVRYQGYRAEDCDQTILCSNNEESFNIEGCGCGCLFLL